MQTTSDSSYANDSSILRRAAIAVGFAAVFFTLFWLLKSTVTVFLTAFASVLMAILLDSLAQPVLRYTRLGRRTAIVLVLFVLMAIGVGIGALVVPSFSREVDELAKTLPEQTKRIEGKILQYRWGRMLLNQASHQAESAEASASDSTDQSDRRAEQPTPPPTTAPTTQQGERLTQTVRAAAEPLMNGAGLFAAGVMNGLLGVVIVLAAGIYLALDPETYRRGLLMLFPISRRPSLDRTLSSMHYTLRWWLIGQFITMLAIGTLTGVGLWLIGVRLWLTFAILAGLFNFVPNFGPLVSFVPAILFAFADPEAGNKIIWITVLYLIAQTFEGYLLTPMVQKKAVDTAPALLILFQLLAGLMMGALGLMLAAPLLAVIVVAVKGLYVREVLGDPVEVAGADLGVTAGQNEPHQDSTVA